MITEKHFALSHAAFWQQLLPTAANYLRECNIEAPRFAKPLESSVPATERGMINETAFRLFAAGIRFGCPLAELSMGVVDECVEFAFNHIKTMREYNREDPRKPGQAGMVEAYDIAERLNSFRRRLALSELVVFPSLPGCGWVDSCHADLFAGGILFEVKAGDRHFHSSDFRQLLCYCALNFSAKRYDIDNVCLVNPRTGRYIGEQLERLCQRTSGRPAVEILSEIVSYISEPQSRIDGVY